MDLDFFFRFNRSSCFLRGRNKNVGPNPEVSRKKTKKLLKKVPQTGFPSSHLKGWQPEKNFNKKQNQRKEIPTYPNIKLHPLLYENNGSLDPGTHQSLFRSLAPASAFLRYPVFSSPLPARALVSTGSPHVPQQRAWGKSWFPSSVHLLFKRLICIWTMSNFEGVVSCKVWIWHNWKLSTLNCYKKTQS